MSSNFSEGQGSKKFFGGSKDYNSFDSESPVNSVDDLEGDFVIGFSKDESLIENLSLAQSLELTKS